MKFKNYFCSVLYYDSITNTTPNETVLIQACSYTDAVRRIEELYPDIIEELHVEEYLKEIYLSPATIEDLKNGKKIL